MSALSFNRTHKFDLGFVEVDQAKWEATEIFPFLSVTGKGKGSKAISEA